MSLSWVTLEQKYRIQATRKYFQKLLFFVSFKVPQKMEGGMRASSFHLVLDAKIALQTQISSLLQNIPQIEKINAKCQNLLVTGYQSKRSSRRFIFPMEEKHMLTKTLSLFIKLPVIRIAPIRKRLWGNSFCISY